MVDSGMRQAKAAYSSRFVATARSFGIAEEAVGGYYDAVFSIALAVAQRHGDAMTTLGMGGAQGSGKSTMARMIQRLLGDVFRLDAETLSMDDFYLTKEQRLVLAREVHPMLAVRGVPGTHDMGRLHAVICQLARGEGCDVPVFIKGDDDRSSMGRRVEPTPILILEGWCWGARPSADDALRVAVNELEFELDPDLVWRRHVNHAVASVDYQACFDNDLSVFLAVPNMDSVFRWRLQQERQLMTGRHPMDEAEIRKFIMYFQRITEDMLARQPGHVDLTVEFRTDHGVGELIRSDGRQ